MALQTGSRLGPYEIVGAIGAGGMGEVYKARDTRLDRTVAIKVLPGHLATDTHFRERFEREARAIAAFQHPHICVLHDVGHQAPSTSSGQAVDFLVMEYLEGETLAARLAKGPLPLEHALQYAIEIADALDKAHRQGITHRDLKPGNVMLTKSGTKLLDFGLAKLRPNTTGGVAQDFSPAGPGGQSALPTMSAPLTGQGTILGTLQYMAPEQLEGKDADARTDIFAFGAIVYEMVTGKKAFEGKSHASLIAAILEREPPPIAASQPLTPSALDHIVRRCLAKDPDERWQAASDVMRELKWIADSGSQASAAAPVVASRKGVLSSRHFAWSVAALALFAALALTAVVAYRSRSTSDRAVARFFVSAPDKTTFVTGTSTATSASISPDGRTLAFTARDSAGKILLWVRPIDALIAQPLTGTDYARYPFWSPDSRFVAYFTQDKLLKIAASGGPPQTLCTTTYGRGGTWNRDGVIVFGGQARPLLRVSSASGEPSPVTQLTAGQTGHYFPSFLPDAHHVLFYVVAGSEEVAGIYVASIDTGESKRLLAADSGAIYAQQGGYLLFVRQGTLLAQSLDPKTLALAGEPFPIAEGVESAGISGVVAFSVSDNGVLAYGAGSGNTALQMVWVDRQGKLIGPVGPEGNYRGLDLAPDGTSVATHRHDGQGATSG